LDLELKRRKKMNEQKWYFSVFFAQKKLKKITNNHMPSANAT